MSLIQPVSQTIDTLLSVYESFEIPLNQRNFEWGREQAEDFWGDLEDAILEDKKVFLGTIVLRVPKKSYNATLLMGNSD